jgi:hypothetical protein
LHLLKFFKIVWFSVVQQFDVNGLHGFDGSFSFILQKENEENCVEWLCCGAK